MRRLFTGTVQAILMLLVILTVASFAHAESRGWRGDGTGLVEGRGYPLEWSADRNVNWRVPLSGHGHSSPVVTADAVVLTLANAEGTRRTVLCFDRADGELRWRRSFESEDPEPTHHRNGYASSTPVTDGRTLYASLGSAGVVALALEDGELRWRRSLDASTQRLGEAAGLRLFEDLLILHRHAAAEPHLLALRRETGERVWRRDLPVADDDENSEGEAAVSLATPLLRRTPLGSELIVTLPGRVAAFNPITGRPYWHVGGLAGEVFASAIVSDDYLAAADEAGRVIALQPPGVETGDVTASTRLFRTSATDAAQIATGVIVDDRLFLADASGRLECVDVQTGRILWREQLAEGVWASLHVAEGRLYVTDVRGTTHVVRLGERFERLARNPLAEGDHVTATPAFSEGQIFIRTYRHLYCIGDRR